MTRLPALDLHAHIETGIAVEELDELRAVVFAVTRSLDEAADAQRRHDRDVIWGVGCHPGVAGAHDGFSTDRFERLISDTAFVGEFGLDGRSEVPLDVQQTTLRAALGVLQRAPRIISLHSYAATELLIHELESQPISGSVLHWWLGDSALTARAVQIGCYFSVNPACVSRRELLDGIPLDRLLPETDHPFGDQRGSRPRRPGNVDDVERGLAAHHELGVSEVRRLFWRNLGELVQKAGCGRLLPRSVRASLAAELSTRGHP